MMVNLPCLLASCANFLRPTYSYTECWLSFLTGSCPKERTTASYSSCLFYLILLTFTATQGSDFSGRTPCFTLLVLLQMKSICFFITYGFLFQNPARIQYYWNPAGVWNTFQSLLLCSLCYLLWSLDIFRESEVPSAVEPMKVWPLLMLWSWHRRMQRWYVRQPQRPATRLL